MVFECSNHWNEHVQRIGFPKELFRYRTIIYSRFHAKYSAGAKIHTDEFELLSNTD